MDCPLCLGTGLIGNGDQPHLQQGALKTCPNCIGTGKIEAPTDEKVDMPENNEQQPQDETVDNPPGADAPRGILRRILG